jgi:hypothetical protein
MSLFSFDICLSVCEGNKPKTAKRLLMKYHNGQTHEDLSRRRGTGILHHGLFAFLRASRMQLAKYIYPSEACFEEKL